MNCWCSSRISEKFQRNSRGSICSSHFPWLQWNSTWILLEWWKDFLVGCHEELRLGNRRKGKPIVMFSDSISKGIRIREFNRYITNVTARMKCFPGATSKELAHYVYQHYKKNLIHIGINDILKNQSWKYLINVKEMVSRRLLYCH